MDKKILRGAVKAFTLLELIVVIAIIVIMSSILIPNVSNQRRMAKIQSENDQAYQIYVAAQDYLNNLQKRGLKSEDYFGEIEFDSKKYGVMMVDEGTLDLLHSGGKGVETGKIEATEANLKTAYKQIVKRMGIRFKKEEDEFETSKGTSALRSKTLYGQGLSFCVLVNNRTYTVSCVYATDYKTKDSASTSSTYKMFHKVASTTDWKTANNTNAGKTLLKYGGFSSTQSLANGKANQENATKYGRKIAEPIYMGQYPIPMS